MLPSHAPKPAPSLPTLQRGGNTLGTWDLREKQPGRKIKRRGIPLLLPGKQKHPFPSTSWQVGACLPPVWTSSPKRSSDSLSVFPSPHPGKSLPLGKGGGDGENKRDIGLTDIAGSWASDVIKTLPSTISRQNEYYFMREEKVSQECEGGSEGPSLAVIGMLQRRGSKWPNVREGGCHRVAPPPHSWDSMGWGWDQEERGEESPSSQTDWPTPFCARRGGTDWSKWKAPGGSVFQPEKHAWGFPVQLQYKRPLRLGNLERGVGQGRAGLLEGFTYIRLKTAGPDLPPRMLCNIGRVPSQHWTSVSHP
ncbi:uncharacterized protein LOC121494681 [Vulpes lagopus]|uniref:uncharacterized protein LOC121494681 n=1 Tax=Vulpes lagopus TaxID=494514 RepID=UPI001BC8D380|nr:uncharacterized protein LOC121494681 [Vulpes lagopus]XP_041617316.1 uncharacterized protein LOC121494681 [Vulpes lagopus]